MKKIVLITCLICFILTGCTSTSNNKNTSQETESTLSAEEQASQKIYDEALDLAYDGDFYSAIQKLNELTEPYLDSEEMITVLQKDVDSLFIGTWHCSRANSCNDMEITLRIYPVYRSGEIELYFERDMVSSTGTGSSNLTGTIDIPSSSSITVSRLNSAKWTVSGNTLKEVFSCDGNKTNTYSK